MKTKFYTDFWYCKRTDLPAVLEDLKAYFGNRKVSITYRPCFDHHRIGNRFAVLFVQPTGTPGECRIVGNIGNIISCQ